MDRLSPPNAQDLIYNVHRLPASRCDRVVYLRVSAGNVHVLADRIAYPKIPNILSTQKTLLSQRFSLQHFLFLTLFYSMFSAVKDDLRFIFALRFYSPFHFSQRLRHQV